LVRQRGLDRAHHDVLQAARKAGLDILADRPVAARDHPQAAFLHDRHSVVSGTDARQHTPLLIWLDELASRLATEGDLIAGRTNSPVA
jgi:hypothetical protein